MTDNPDPAHRIFVSYIDKSRDYYAAQGFTNPYRWAYHRDAPFTRLAKPLAQSRVGLITTASLSPEDPVRPEAFAVPSDPPPPLFTNQRSWDKEATHTDDLDSFAPVNRLREAAASGRIASASPRLYGVPTEYSQRKTVQSDAPRLLEFLREDGVDVAIFVPL